MTPGARNSITIALVGLLSGCSGSEAKVVDLGGLVFLVFLFLTVSKYFSPYLASFRVFTEMKNFCARVGSQLFYASILVGLVLNIYGFVNETIDQLLGLLGLSLIIGSYHLKDLASEDVYIANRAIDVIGLSSVISIVMLSLWYFGAEMLRI